VKRRSKRYQDIMKKLEDGKRYSASEAVRLIKDTSRAKFEESVDVSIALNIKPKARGERVRGTVSLPHGTGRETRILVFAKGDKVEEARKAGASWIGDSEIIAKIEKGWVDFDQVVATPDMMRDIAKLGRVLGPRGLMPSPKVGTVSDNPASVVEELKKGKIEYKNDASGGIHVCIGKLSFSEDALLENLKALLGSLLKDKPSTAKGVFFKGIALSSTIGPAIRLDLTNLVEDL